MSVKVRLGDLVATDDFGPGAVVAMSKQWCIYVDNCGNEYAVTWDDIYIPPDDVQNGGVESSVEEKEIWSFQKQTSKKCTCALCLAGGKCQEEYGKEKQPYDD